MRRSYRTWTSTATGRLTGRTWPGSAIASASSCRSFECRAQAMVNDRRCHRLEELDSSQLCLPHALDAVHRNDLMVLAQRRTPAPRTLTVSNLAPVVGGLSAPLDPVRVNTAVNTGAAFADPGTLDSHTAVWTWGDGTSSAGTVNEAGGVGSVTGSHS